MNNGNKSKRKLDIKKMVAHVSLAASGVAVGLVAAVMMAPTADCAGPKLPPYNGD